VSRRGWARERALLFSEPEAPESGPRSAAPRPRAEIVGRDLAGAPRRAQSRARLRLPIALGAIAAALLLVTLRIEILRLRYALAEVASEEHALLEHSRQLTVRVRELRDPKRLRRLAVERGFTRPDRVLSVPLRGAAATSEPAVGAGPP
jgi:hypothetical protein